MAPALLAPMPNATPEPVPPLPVTVKLATVAPVAAVLVITTLPETPVAIRFAPVAPKVVELARKAAFSVPTVVASVALLASVPTFTVGPPTIENVRSCVPAAGAVPRFNMSLALVAETAAGVAPKPNASPEPP